MDKYNQILASFTAQDILNPKIWDNPGKPSKSQMKPKVREALIDIANEFIEYLDVPMFVQGITMTGSLANFNWSQFSDIDLHLMVNFDQFGKEEELYKDLLGLKKTLFNSQHDIKIYGYEVELYVQDISETHFSSGVYSVSEGEWNIPPKKVHVEIDKNQLKSKVKSWTDQIDSLLDNLEGEDSGIIKKSIDNLKDKLKKYRSTGLEQGGEYSYENLTFKFLRRNGYVQKLFDMENKMVDKNLSLETKVTE
jgi:hypothetical protein